MLTSLQSSPTCSSTTFVAWDIQRAALQKMAVARPHYRIMRAGQGRADV
jgi:hypothetical protein